MRSLVAPVLVVLLLSSSFLAGQIPGDLVRGAKIGMGEAIATALGACPGRAVEAELEATKRKGKSTLVFEVVVITAKKEMKEVIIDATSGKLLELEDCDDADERAERKAFLRVLRHCELGLAALVAKGADVVKGTPVEAILELEDGHPVCEVTFVNSRYHIEVEIEARAGHLIEIELESSGDDDDDEDDDEKKSGEGEGGKQKGRKDDDDHD